MPARVFSLIPIAPGFLVLLIFGVLGCASIQSRAVRTLIDVETEKVGQAGKNSEDFVKASDRAIDNWKESVEALSSALQKQRAVESVHSLVFSANRDIETKTGIEAHAATYLIGELYLAERMGLEQAVLDQFNEDYQALKKLAKQIRESWKALAKTQKEVAAFADGTFLRTLDPDFARALIVEFGGDPESIDDVLVRSRQVNEALKKASGSGLLGGSDSSRPQTVTGEVINLLERIKK
jgi:hypothetical protein